jgi:hypothetical protein
MTINLEPSSDDVLIDIERFDAENRGKMTDVKKFTIRRLHEKHGVSVEKITVRLSLSETDVKNALAILEAR